jgi:hypothetical protein
MTEPRRRRAITTPGTLADPSRRGPGSFVAAVIVQMITVLVIVQLVFMPSDWMRRFASKTEPLHSEQIGFFALPKPDGERAPAKAGGDNRPARVDRLQLPPKLVPIYAPTGVPTSLPAEPLRPAAPDVGGAGPLIGGGGPTRGVRPSYNDPRVWAGPATVVMAPKTPSQRLDSVIAQGIYKMRDSIDSLPRERAPGDWTKKIGDKTYGIDQKYIHLGKYSIPTALLALLPLNVQGNPATAEKNQRLGMIRSEILEQSARMGRDDEFRAAVKALRERKDKERAAKKAADAPVTPVPDKVPVQP